LAELKIIEIEQGELEASGLGKALADAPLRGLPDSVRDAVEVSQQLANRDTPHPAASMFGVFDLQMSISVSRLDLAKSTSADPPVPSPLRKLGFA
jgi:hypothetical protein